MRPFNRFATCGMAPVQILAVLGLSCAFGSGCVTVDTDKPPVWTYTCDLSTENLYGTGDNNTLHFWGNYKLLRRTDDQIVIAFDGRYDTWILMDISVPSGKPDGGRWNACTSAGQLKAWLVRNPDSVEAQPLRGYGYADVPTMLSVVDGHPAPTSQDRPAFFPLEGTVTISADKKHVLSITLEFVSTLPVPVFRSYYEHEISVAAYFVDLHKNDAPTWCFFRFETEDEKRLAKLRAEFSHQVMKPARVRGRIRGWWEPVYKIPL